MKTNILLALALFFPFLGMSQLIDQSQSKPNIEVVGTGEMEIVPDEIYIAFTLKERFEGKNKIGIEDQEKTLKKELLKMGINLDNLQLADASADYIKVKWSKKDVIASKDYVLKVTDTKTLAGVFDVLDHIDAYGAKIWKTDHSKIEDYRKAVKIMAIKAAKEKAGYLLEAIGKKVGDPLYIQERESYDDFVPNRLMMAKGAMVAESEAADEPLPELSFQKIKLKYSVFARFSIQ
jgi:hypothetical protein